MDLLARFVVGLCASLAIGYFGYRRGSLAPSGVVGAVLVGTSLFTFGGAGAGVLLIAFFVTSSAWSHYKRRQKEREVEEKFSKGARRDIAQALANGGPAVLLALGWWLWPCAGPWLPALVAALATVNGDTWATEIGVLSRSAPRLITTLQVTTPGTSGGVTRLGTAAALGGAALIGVLAEGMQAVGGFAAPTYALGSLVLAGAVGGLAGALFDSVLGATVQTIYWCETCGKETERTVHPCGTVTRRLRGWAWLDNDWVNFLAALVGAAVGAGVAWGAAGCG